MASAYEGVYARMKFPPFVQKEFPKLLYKPGDRKTFVEVGDKRAELEQLAEWNQQPSGDAVADLAVERDVLAAQATDKDRQIAELTARLNTLTLAVAQSNADKVRDATAKVAPGAAKVSPALAATAAQSATKTTPPTQAFASPAKTDAPAEGNI